MVGAILGNKNFGDQAAQLSNGINQTYCSPIFVLVVTTESHYLSKKLPLCVFIYDLNRWERDGNDRSESCKATVPMVVSIVKFFAQLKTTFETSDDI